MRHEMYSEYTMTFWDLVDWLGGWDNADTRNILFNGLYTANQEVCNILMEAFLYREIGYEVPGRFVHEFGEQFTRCLPEYKIRKRMWDELQTDTVLLYDLGGLTERVLSDIIDKTTNDTHSGSDTHTSEQTTNSTSNANQDSNGKTITDQGITLNKSMIHSDTPGNNLDWSKNYADVAQKDTSNQNTDETVTSDNTTTSTTKNNASGNASSTTNYGKKIDKTEDTDRKVTEMITKKLLNGKTKFQIYQLFTASTPEKWFIKQFDKQFMQIFGG